MTVRRRRGVGKGLGGNREVSPYVLRGRRRRGDLSGAQAAADLEEGGTRGKCGFPRGSELEANDTPGAPTSEIVDFLKGKVPV
jgi:hypothetical protein